MMMCFTVCTCTRTSQTMPLTPLKRPGDRTKDSTAVPFLSTPVSVKKARLYIDILHTYIHVIIPLSILLWQN